jgi:hypothetical protein
MSAGSERIVRTAPAAAAAVGAFQLLEVVAHDHDQVAARTGTVLPANRKKLVAPVVSRQRPATPHVRSGDCTDDASSCWRSLLCRDTCWWKSGPKVDADTTAP